MTYSDYVAAIRSRLNDAVLYEQLAEEAAELAQAALKAARIMRGENPTPIKWDEARDNVIEECVDVAICENVLKIPTIHSLYSKKLKRWYERLTEAEKNEKEHPTSHLNCETIKPEPKPCSTAIKEFWEGLSDTMDMDKDRIFGMLFYK